MARRRVKKRMNARPIVNWQPGAAPSQRSSVIKQYPYFTIEPSVSSRFAGYMTIGTPFVTKSRTSSPDEPGILRPHPVLWIAWNPDGSFEPGTLFMYAGTVRCKEQRVKGDTIVVPRYTFIGPTGRFIVIGPENVFVPVAEVGVSYSFAPTNI